jgi:hypothetical protein
MKLLRAILLSVIWLAVGSASAQPKGHYDSADSAKSIDEIKKSLPIASNWKEITFANRKYLFATTDQGDGESYIDLDCWIYNRHFEEWRRVFNIKTRNLGSVELLIDNQKGIVSLRGAANNRLKDVEAFRYDLRVTNDDAAYEK